MFSKFTLAAAYKACGVKYKTVRLRSGPNPSTYVHGSIEVDERALKQHVEALYQSGLEPVLLDECCYTWRGHTKLEWAPKYINLTLAKVAAVQGH